ncbi:glycosyltransferase family 2 protein [Massilimicrobiota timonensis]|uniref:glycosyltransferase family 2 protein n=1 Tax=Massilimicrobiota timonensis TaxID=1776392 RepID=UPI00196053E4|nr:glycosyltransferase family 2 protein [Massilimicrobiota timonensis]MBM6967188.1 glycosyltransferase family 2 protein [Massilimicrobiota timonensis]
MLYEKDMISVITPCYNGEKYLDRYFTSILNQTYHNIQIVIIDDGSTDNSGKIIESYRSILEMNGIQLEHIKQQNSGQAVAINNGLKYVKGEFMVWPDCDDYYESDALFSMMNYMKNNSFNFIRGISAFRNEDNLLDIIRYGKSKNPSNYNIFDNYVFETDSYTFAGIFMVRMKYFDQCFKDRKIFSDTRAGQNWQLILPLAYNDYCGYLDKLVYNVVLTKSSHSRKNRTIIDQIKRILELKRVLINSINQIDLKKNVKLLYSFRVNYKYLKIFLKTIFITPLKRQIKKFLRGR